MGKTKSLHIGYYKNDECHGQVTRIYSSGDIHNSTFYEGERHGPDVRIDVNGYKEECNYEYGYEKN